MHLNISRISVRFYETDCRRWTRRCLILKRSTHNIILKFWAYWRFFPQKFILANVEDFCGESRFWKSFCKICDGLYYDCQNVFISRFLAQETLIHHYTAQLWKIFHIIILHINKNPYWQQHSKNSDKRFGTKETF